MSRKSQSFGASRSEASRQPAPLELAAWSPAIDALPLPAAVLFDLDGTLVDTVETRIAAWEQALERGRPADQARSARAADRARRQAPGARDRGARRPADRRARAEEIDRESGEIYERLNASPRPLPGRRPLVDDARAARDRLGDRHVEPQGAGRGRPSRRWGSPASRRSSTRATSSTPSRSRTCCCWRRSSSGVEPAALLVRRRFDVGHGLGRRRGHDRDRRHGGLGGRRRDARGRRCRGRRRDARRARGVDRVALAPVRGRQPRAAPRSRRTRILDDLRDERRSGSAVSRGTGSFRCPDRYGASASPRASITALARRETGCSGVLYASYDTRNWPPWLRRAGIPYAMVSVASGAAALIGRPEVFHAGTPLVGQASRDTRPRSAAPPSSAPGTQRRCAISPMILASPAIGRDHDRPVARVGRSTQA